MRSSKRHKTRDPQAGGAAGWDSALAPAPAVRASASSCSADGAKGDGIDGLWTELMDTELGEIARWHETAIKPHVRSIAEQYSIDRESSPDNARPAAAKKDLEKLRKLEEIIVSAGEERDQVIEGLGTNVLNVLSRCEYPLGIGAELKRRFPNPADRLAGADELLYPSGAVNVPVFQTIDGRRAEAPADTRALQAEIEAAHHPAFDVEAIEAAYEQLNRARIAAIDNALEMLPEDVGGAPRRLAPYFLAYDVTLLVGAVRPDKITSQRMGLVAEIVRIINEWVTGDEELANKKRIIEEVVGQYKTGKWQVKMRILHDDDEQTVAAKLRPLKFKSVHLCHVAGWGRPLYVRGVTTPA